MFEKYNNFKITPPYHDGRRLLNMLDIDKQKPGFFIDTSNRSAGKTTFYNGYLVDNFLKKGIALPVRMVYNKLASEA